MRNQRCRALHGNTSLRVSWLNCGGLNSAGRWAALLATDTDILCLSETHHLTYEQQPLAQLAVDWHVLWGHGTDVRDYQGVAILIRKHLAPHVRPVHWDEGSSCHSLWQQRRLAACELHISTTSVLIYVVYGFVDPKHRKQRDLSNHMFHDVLAQLAAHGDLACYLGGDFNTDLCSSPPLRDALDARLLVDLRRLAPPEVQSLHTYHGGGSQSGTQIDHALGTHIAAGMTTCFNVHPIPGIKKHMAVTIAYSPPSGSQTVKFQRRPAPLCLEHQGLRLPPRSRYRELFNNAMGAGNLNQALSHWSYEAEALLQQAASQMGQPLSSGAAPRGRLVLQERRLHPRPATQIATTLCTRSLLAGVRRAQEVSKCPPGTRAERTWAAIKSALRYCRGNDAWHYLLDLPPSHDRAEQVYHHLMQELERQQQADKYVRINLWKSSMQRERAQRYSWIRRRDLHPRTRLMTTNGSITANMHTKHEELHNFWDKLYHTHADGEPTLRRFLEMYGKTMRTSLVSLPLLTGQDLVDELRKVKESAPGLDQWAPAELQSLSRLCPELFDDLARIYNSIEEGNPWPQILVDAYVAFVPKDSLQDAPTADQHRPISVLSAIYRLYSSVRHRQLARLWLPLWRPDAAYGTPAGGSAEDLVYDTAWALEQWRTEHLRVAGLSYDMKKCFDTLPIQLTLAIARHRGMSLNVLQAVAGFYSAHRKWYRVDGSFTSPMRPSNGLIQGCPMSMLLLTCLTSAWLEETATSPSSSSSNICPSQQRPPSQPPPPPQPQSQQQQRRSYADDLSVIQAAENAPALKEVTVNAHTSTTSFAAASGMSLQLQKTFTFGDKAVQALLPKVPIHKDGFRLVGGTLRSTSSPTWTEQEQAREHKRRRTLDGLGLDIFETPVTVTPQQEISKTLNSSKIP